MKLGILFVQGDGIIGKCIQWLTKGAFSHVAFIISDEWHIFETEYLTRARILQKEHVDYWELYHEIMWLELNEEETDILHEEIGNTIGLHYDYLQIAKIFLKVVFGRKIKRIDNKEFICSELVAYILWRLGKLKDMDAINYSPNKLYKYLKQEGY